MSDESNLSQDSLSSDVVWHQHKIGKIERSCAKQQKACVIWFTGLSGSGKSTIANLLEQKLFALGKHSYLLDGDNVRHGLCGDLAFSDKDRVENIRRISEVGKLLVDAGLLVLTAFISPFKTDRHFARGLLDKNEFVEVFIDAPLEVCEKRDPKGLYKKARRGEIKQFTGIDSEYQVPTNPEIVINTAKMNPKDAVEAIIDYLTENKFLSE